MQLGDPKNAAAAFDILSDYFNNNFSELKQSDKRHGKRRQLLAEPLQETASNPSLRSPLGLNKHDKCGDASSVLSDLSVTPIIQRNRTHVSKPAVSSEASSELSVKSAFSKKPDLHVEDYHNVADLVHRLTQRTGLQPGQVRVTKTPDSVAEKAAHIADLQYKELRYSDRMQQILAELMVVNTRLTSIVPAVAGHRRDWGKIVEDSNHVYLRLFESMMSEILLIHRKKFKSQTKDLMELRAAKGLVDEEIVQLKKANEILKSRVNNTELEFDKLRTLLRARDRQVTMLTEEIERLDEIRKDYMQYMAEIRDINARRDKEREELEARLRAEEQAALKAQLEELQAQFNRTQAMLREAQANAMARDMANSMDIRVKKAPTADGGSQTEFTEFDVFDKQDGWFLPVSGTAVARIRWRRALNFSSCPACRGVGKQVMATAILLRRLVRGDSEAKKPKKGAGVWMLPDELVQFVCNLPRSVMAYRPYALSWTVNRITHMFMTKVVADEEDIDAGYPIQSLEQFIIEKYLMVTEDRSQAESGVHRLLQSVKEHHKRHPLLHTFARFLGILQDPDSTRGEDHEHSDKKRRSTAKKKSAIQQEMAVIDELLKPSSKDLPLTVLSIYLFARNEMLRPGYCGAYAEAIDRARNYGNGDLLKYERMVATASTRPPKMVSKYADKDSKPTAGSKRGSINARKGSVSDSTLSSAMDTTTQGEEAVDCVTDDLCDPVAAIDMGRKWAIGLEPHVCVFSNFTMWIPLDRAIEVVNKVLNFLTDSQLLAVCRRIEHISSFLSPHGSLTSADGNHSEIRQHVRVFLPTAQSDGSMVNDGGVAAKIAAFVEAQRHLEPSRQYTVVVNLDDALQTIAEMLLTRISHMEERLSRIFYEGDTNGDGILSYDEFLDIVNRIAPHISKRRVLGMYREVLMMGDDSEKIELPSFIAICKKYGLVKLVDLKVIYDQQRKESFSKPSSAGTPYHSFSDLDEPSIDSKAARGSQLRRIESIPEEFAESAYEEIEEEPQLHSLYLDADEVSDETKEFT